jgi:lysozyme family protein
MNRFEACMPFVFEEEGGYADHPADPGGETNFGISKRQYPDLDIRALTRDQAMAIYRRDYWDAFRCDELPIGMDLMMFDAAVQHQPKTAVSLIQRAVGAAVDGMIGPATLGAARAADLEKAIIRYFIARAGLYTNLITADASKAAFRDGWFARLFRLHAEVRRTMELPR